MRRRSDEMGQESDETGQESDEMGQESDEIGQESDGMMNVIRGTTAGTRICGSTAARRVL